jgi:GrpB-like predicted nucleotidyltransferase (UPF0157 family)
MTNSPVAHVELAAYDPAWPGEFRAIAGHLRSLLGAAALRIDHIGSTAVANLASKNVIDVQITAESLDDPEQIRGPLAAAGYQFCALVARDHRPPDASGPDSDWQKLFLYNAPGQRRCNIHVRVLGRPNQIYPILVRDFLRAHPRSAEAFCGRLKVLAPLVPVEEYPDVKDPVCDLIYEHAQAWAGQTRWQPPPSDG